MADHQTAGGYPVVATVVSAMPVAAQLLPGDEVSFAEVNVEAALRMRAVQRSALGSLRLEAFSARGQAYSRHRRPEARKGWRRQSALLCVTTRAALDALGAKMPKLRRLRP